MFELNRAVAQWRRGMAKAIKDLVVLEEMEAHLRDDIEQRISSGATAEVAFEAAVHTFGRPELIRAEFRKVRSSGGTLAWGVRFLLPACILGLNAWTLCAYEIPILQRRLAILTISLLSLLVVCWPKVRIKLYGARSSSTLKLTKATLAVLWFWPFWALLEALGVVHSGLSIVAAALIWSMYGVAAAIACMEALGRNDRQGGGLGGTLAVSTPGHPLPPTGSGMLANSLFQAAQDEATRFGHDYIGTEHLLLGLLQQAPEPLANLLRTIGIDGDRVREQIEQIMGTASPTTAHPSRFTPRASRAIKLAAREAKLSKQQQLTPELIFLGLLLEGEGLAAVVLRKLGVQLEATRREILRFRK